MTAVRTPNKKTPRANGESTSETRTKETNVFNVTAPTTDSGSICQPIAQVRKLGEGFVTYGYSIGADDRFPDQVGN